MKINNYISCQSGHKFYFPDMKKSVIDICDIAHGLSNVCRFGGQCRPFYSIAEHVINVSKMVPKKYAFCGLMHDAAEAYIHDITTPLKVRLPDYKAMEAELDAHIAQLFGYEYPFPPEVKTADWGMFLTEYDVLFPNKRGFIFEEKDDFEFEEPPYKGKVPFKFYSPEQAYDAFIERYIELGGK